MTAVYTVFLTLGVLASGISIPLILTFQNHRVIDKGDGEETFFTQPLLQTAMMFLGEILCILVIHLERKSPSLLDRSLLDAAQNEGGGPERGEDWAVPRTTMWSRSAFWFALPTACDLIATTLMNLGLILSTPSVFQIMRSSLIGFSAILSCVFLSRRFTCNKWAAVAVILTGTIVVVVGASLDSYYLGPLLLVAAQVFVACQFILEEHLMERYHLDPVRAMGIEGIFGSVLITLTLIVAALSGVGVFDIRAGVVQLIDSYVLWQSALVLALMVAACNFFGFAVSVAVDVPGRSVIDAVRMVVIWLVAIHYGWDTFSWLELAGVILVLFGVFIFNGVFKDVYTAAKSACPWKRSEESAPLLASS